MTLDRLSEQFFDWWWRANPTHATAVGVHMHDEELEQFDSASLTEKISAMQGFLAAFDAHEPKSLDEEIDRTLLQNHIRWELLEFEKIKTYTRNPAFYLDTALNALYLMAARDYAPAAERALAAVARLEKLPRLLEQARQNLTDARAVFVDTAAAVARSATALVDGMLETRLGSALPAGSAERARWMAASSAANAGLLAFARWLEEEVAPGASAEFAYGRWAFEARIRLAHGLPYSADNLREFGLALIRNTHGQLEALGDELGGDWQEIAEAAKEEHPAADELIDAYATEMARAREFVEAHGLVTVPANELLVVTATPHYLRPVIPYAAYVPPAAHEQEQKGIFLVTPPEPARAAEMLRDHSRYGISVTALHEAYPGHHLQLTRANQAPSEARRIFWTSVFAEGWALYCEEMMWEEGFYTDPRQRLLQLKDQLWRACRVVADVGLHVGGWTFDRAVDFMVREAGLERANAEIEVRRYCAEPTQPMSYAVGKREIMQIRADARAQKGASFDLRAFHDELLSWGTIPPPLVARGMGLR